MLRARLVPLAFSVLVLNLVSPCFAAPATSHSCDIDRTSAARPRIGLVLSGGGARGLAHVGVLKVLEELKIPIDCIAGTSVGAVVGGLYASGMSAQEIETLMRSLNWQDAFRDRPSRRDLAFRRKQDDRNFLVRLPLGLKHYSILLPRGLVQGQTLEQMMRTLTLQVGSKPDFDHLPTPFRAVATNLETGRGVRIDSGDLATAMRASMSLPGVFAPVDRNGELLVDGGLAENLPMDVARSMGADILLVVDVSFQLEKRDQLNTALAISNQTLAILVRKDTERQKETMTARDILIEPQLGNIASTDFAASEKAIDIGKSAARALGDRLKGLSVSDDEYRNYLVRRTARVPANPRIDFVSVDPLAKRYEPTILAVMKPLVGQPLDPKKIESGFTELYGLDNFETLDYSIVQSGSGDAVRNGIEVYAKRKSWGPNYIRFGLNLQDDFEGNSSYNAAVRFIVTEINNLGGEWLTDLQIGQNPRAFTELYQPLTADRSWFLAPSMRVEVRTLPVYQGTALIADYRVRTAESDLDFGRELGNWGEIRAGLHFSSGATHVRVGDPNLPTDQFQVGEYFAKFSYDRLDNIDFPRQGQTLSFQWDARRSNLGSDHRADRVQADYLWAGSRGRNTLVWWSSAGTTLDGDSRQIQDLYALGGFFNLSGRPPQSVTGSNFAITRAIYFRKVGRGGEGFLDFPAYLGMSLEIGNAWDKRGDISFGSARKDGALFLGLDTFLGPLYIGAGVDQTGSNAYYLFLGRTF